MDEDLEWGFRQVYGREPHQYCVKHMAREVDRLTNYAAINKKLTQLRAQLDELQILATQRGKAWVNERNKKIERIQRTLKKIACEHARELELRDLAYAFIYAKSKKEALSAFNKIMREQRRFKKGDLPNLIAAFKKEERTSRTL